MSAPRTPDEWIAHAERIARLPPGAATGSIVPMRDLSRRLGVTFTGPVVVIAGTNGKSSTAAMMEAIALQAGYRVGLHLSPSLVRFEEGCRVGGEALDVEALQPHFEAVDAGRGPMPLTAKAFVMLAVLRALASRPLDLVILEAGEGGALDPVACIEADCTVLTSIDVTSTRDADDREAAGATVASWLRAGGKAVIGDPMPPASLLAYAQAMGVDLLVSGRDFRFGGDRQQWAWSGRLKRFNALAYPALRGANQLLNAAAALAAFELLRDMVPITAQAVRNGLAMVELPGRFQLVPGQPTLVLDIADNVHAAATLLQNLDQMGFHPRTHALFGATRDMPVDALITRLSAVVDDWYFVDLPIANASTAADLRATFERLAPKGPGPVNVHEHCDPAAALAAAVVAADPADRIVVFGSFAVVGGILLQGVPRMPAPHAASGGTPGPRLKPE